MRFIVALALAVAACGRPAPLSLSISACPSSVGSASSSAAQSPATLTARPSHASRTLVAINGGRLVSTVISAARPSLATDGVDITSWRDNGTFAPPLAAMMISGDEAMTLTSPAGGTRGVELYGYSVLNGSGHWWLIGYVNDGQDIVIASATLGYAQEVDVLGVFTRLEVVAGGIPVGHTALAQFAPIDHWGV